MVDDPADETFPDYEPDPDQGWDGEPEGTHPDEVPDDDQGPEWWGQEGAPQEDPGQAPDTGLVRVPSDDADTVLIYYRDGTVEERERPVIPDEHVPDLPEDGDPFDPDAAAAGRGFQWVTTNVPRPPLWTPQQAVAQARIQVTRDTCPHYSNYGGLCLHFCACMYGFSSSGTYDAASMWRLMPNKWCHYEDHSPPVGALVMWYGGSSGHGHISIVVAPGMIASNDIRRYGRIDVVPLSEISARWGQDYKGWTPPYFARGHGTNGQKPPFSKPEPSPWSRGDVYVSKLHLGQEHSDSVRRLKWRLRNHNEVPKHFQADIDMTTGTYGDGARDAARWWQRNIAERGTTPQNGEWVSAAQANRLFGDGYHVHEPQRKHRHSQHAHAQHGGGDKGHHVRPPAPRGPETDERGRDAKERAADHQPNGGDAGGDRG